MEMIKSKLDTLLEMLRRDDRVEVVKVHSINLLRELDINHPCAEVVEILFSPRTGIYAPEKLSQFLGAFAPSGVLWARCFMSGRGDSQELQVGTFQFDENVGTVRVARRVELEITDPKLRAPAGAGGRKAKKARLFRRVIVRVYPDRGTADKATGSYRISLRELIARGAGRDVLRQAGWDA